MTLSVKGRKMLVVYAATGVNPVLFKKDRTCVRTTSVRTRLFINFQLPWRGTARANAQCFSRVMHVIPCTNYNVLWKRCLEKTTFLGTICCACKCLRSLYLNYTSVLAGPRTCFDSSREERRSLSCSLMT
jgi:hypothetical protein